MYSSMMTSSKCGTSLSVGEDIMRYTAVSSTSRTVSFEDSTGTAVACGSEYTAGATYTAQLSSTSNQYVIEISGGTFDSGSCSGARVTSNGERLTAPTDGGDLFGWAGWSSSYSVAVSISDTCTLVAPTTTPAPTMPAPTPCPLSVSVSVSGWDPCSVTPAPTIVPWTYVGCFADSESRDLSYSTWWSGDLTIRLCYDACVDAGYSVFGMQNGNECYCDDDYGGQGASSECTMACSGSDAEICGGGWANSVFILSTVTSPPTTTPAPKTPAPTPCRRSGGFACSMTPAPTIVPWIYVGCFADSGSRDLSYYAGSNGDLTVRQCYDACVDAGYSVFGMQYGSECYCDDDYGGQGASSECTMACSGNDAEICGGNFANSVFILSTAEPSVSSPPTATPQPTPVSAPPSSTPTYRGKIDVCDRFKWRTCASDADCAYETWEYGDYLSGVGIADWEDVSFDSYGTYECVVPPIDGCNVSRCVPMLVSAFSCANETDCFDGDACNDIDDATGRGVCGACAATPGYAEGACHQPFTTGNDDGVPSFSEGESGCAGDHCLHVCA